VAKLALRSMAKPKIDAQIYCSKGRSAIHPLYK
jgi:hypothetical protein